MREWLGLPAGELQQRLQALTGQAGVPEISWQRTSPPRGPVGTEERVVQVRDEGEGRAVVVTACFPSLPEPHEP